MKPPDIKGLNLKTDTAIHEICKISNETSGRTRSVLYVLMLVSILAVISVLNSYEFKYLKNWTAIRIAKNVNAIDDGFQQAAAGNVTEKDSLSNPIYDSLVAVFNLEMTKRRLDNNLKNEMENVHLVKVPVLGNQFDINDLGLVAGLTMVILMILLKFTQTREVNNLKIAFEAITKRYPEDSDEEDFNSYFEKNGFKENAARKESLAAINFIRRQHHYNYLSMNEIFSSPPLEIIDNEKSGKISKRIIMKMFWMPFVIYLLIFINDLNSLTKGLTLSAPNTIMLLGLEFLFSCCIFYYAKENTRLIRSILVLYIDFKNNGYRNYSSNS